MKGTGTSSFQLEDEMSTALIEGQGSEELLFCRTLPSRGSLLIEARGKIHQPYFGFVFQSEEEEHRHSLLFNKGDYELDLWRMNENDEELSGLGFPPEHWDTVTFLRTESTLSIQRSYASDSIEEKDLSGPVNQLCLSIPDGQGKVSLDYVRIRKEESKNLNVSLGKEEDRPQF